METTKVYMTPTPSHAASDTTNSINQIVLRLRDLLPAYGVELVENPDIADVVACHAGMSDRKIADVAHISGLYPTAHFPQFDWHWSANDFVLENVRRAQLVTVPSEWVADLFRRDMHFDPAVVAWGIDTDEWLPAENGGFVLWNKTRVDGVCDPTPLNELARLSPEQKFITTFGNGLTNVAVTGRLPYERMKMLIRQASVYLGTTLETFGIGTLEAMSCGVPVLGFAWGGTADIVKHGVTGYLVQPGDYDGLKEGLAYCLKYRDMLGANAREAAKEYTWQKTAQALAGYYENIKFDKVMQRAFSGNPVLKVAVVIPCHNYENYVGEAIRSVAAQVTEFQYEIIVVNDGSTDNSAGRARAAIEELGLKNAKVISHINKGVAFTRNRGIAETDAPYIVCLDADDMLGDPSFLQMCADALDKRRDLGIVYTRLQVIDAQGNLSNVESDWPGPHDYEMQLKGRNQVPTCCMFRREAWARAGGYRQKYAPAEDARLWLDIGAIGYRAEMITERKMFHYRMHTNSLSSDIREGKRPEPNWRDGLHWIESGNRPFACDGLPPRMSWPVHHYMLPTISVIIPLGPGHEDRLQGAIDSVKAQTYPYWELIVVVDDGKPESSTDEIDLSYAPYARVIYVSSIAEEYERPVGSGAARNIGVRAAKAPLVLFLDADDEIRPDALEKMLRAYRQTGKYIYSDWISQNKQGVYEPHLTPDYDPDLVFIRTSIHAVTILIERGIMLENPFDELMPSWEDTDLQMKLASKGICGQRVAEPLLLYRYQTGYRRELGEAQKQALIDFLAERYKLWVREGEKVCCGFNRRALMPPQFAFEPNGKPSLNTEEIVKISYKGGAGRHEVVGIVTRTSYRMHGAKDEFYVYKKDQQAQPDLFVPLTDLPIEVPKTEAPPAPVPYTRPPELVIPDYNA